MQGESLNKLNAAVFALIQAIMTFLVVSDAVNWSEETTAAFMGIVSTGLIVVGYFFAQSPKTNVGES
jgi:hypothetical protein